MRTIIKVDNIELFEFSCSKTFNLGEEVQCYGKPHVVVSIEKRKLNARDREELIVTIEKKEKYNSLKITSNDFKRCGITVAKSSVEPLSLGIKSATDSFNRNPFDSIRGY